MKVNWPVLDVTKAGNTLEQMRSGFVLPAIQALNALRAMHAGGHMLKDNQNAAVIEVEFTHGEETLVANP